MRLRVVLTAAALATAAAGCGTKHDPLSPACLAAPATIERALQAAPGAVRLTDGTALSGCVAHARSDGDMQTAGIVLTRAADHLAQQAAARGDRAAATRLGYLIGALRRGSVAGETRGIGIHAELVRRVEQAAGELEGHPRLSAALRGGIAAGEATG
jgi:hypothetical protein